MRCPFCKNQDTKVIDTRMIEDGASVRRRRKCPACDARFTTYERFNSSSLMVVKKSNRREPFDREKIHLGICRACNKRSIDAAVIEQAVDAIESDIRRNAKSEVRGEDIGRMVMDKLREIDEVAYVRFASVYKQFEEPAEFIEEAISLDKK